MTRRPLVATVALLALASCGGEPAPAPRPAPIAAVLEPELLDVGLAVAGGFARGVLQLKAPPASPVTIAAITTSCDCTTAELSLPVTLAAGQSLPIPITVDLGKIARGGLPAEGETAPSVIHREVTVRTDRGAVSHATVEVRVTGIVTVRPALLDVGIVPRGSTGSASALVEPGPAAGGVLRLAGVTPDGDARLRPVVVPGDGSATLAVEWGPFEEAGPVEGWLALSLDAPDAGRAGLRIVGRVVEPVEVEPARIERLDAPLTRPVVAQLDLTRSDGRHLEIRSAVAGNHRVEVRVHPGTGPVRVIELVIPVLAPPAEIDTTLVIETDVEPGGRLTVPVRVRGKR
jgi:hypothetical protein